MAGNGVDGYQAIKTRNKDISVLCRSADTSVRWYLPVSTYINEYRGRLAEPMSNCDACLSVMTLTSGGFCCRLHLYMLANNATDQTKVQCFQLHIFVS